MIVTGISVYHRVRVDRGTQSSNFLRKARPKLFLRFMILYDDIAPPQNMPKLSFPLAVDGIFKLCTSTPVSTAKRR
ncbi:hypothetical protein WG66_014242 [Moniliophthora roreri]|nr:hypothetical protein WG66_014242 [Moniliophthora roreri]